MKKISLVITTVFSGMLALSASVYAEDNMNANPDMVKDLNINSVNTDAVNPSNAEDTKATQCSDCQKCQCSCGHGNEADETEQADDDAQD